MKKKVPGAKWSWCWAGTKFCSSGQSTYKFSRRRFADKLVEDEWQLQGPKMWLIDCLHGYSQDRIWYGRFLTITASLSSKFRGSRRRDFNGFGTLILISIEEETIFMYCGSTWIFILRKSTIWMSRGEFTLFGKIELVPTLSIYLFILYVVIVIYS
jgi:hypothetical protein